MEELLEQLEELRREIMRLRNDLSTETRKGKIEDLEEILRQHGYKLAIRRIDESE